MRILFFFFISLSNIYAQDSIWTKIQLDYKKHCCDSSSFFPTKNYSKVIGFTINEERVGLEPTPSIFDKKEKKIVENIGNKTYELSTLHVDTLLKIINDTSNYVWGEAACFYPHHAFVFYDTLNNIVAYIDICFMCHMVDVFPFSARTKWGGLNEIGFNKYFEFCKLIGMPVPDLNGN